MTDTLKALLLEVYQSPRAYRGLRSRKGGEIPSHLRYTAVELSDDLMHRICKELTP